MKKINKRVLVIIGSIVIGIGVIAGIIAIIISSSGTKLKSITISGVSREVYVGSVDNSSTSLSFSYAPSNVSISELSIYTEDESIAVVESIDTAKKSIVVKAIKEGETNLVVTTRKKSKIIDTCKIIAIDNAVESFNFVTSDDDALVVTNSMQVKRDGYPYEIGYTLSPETANLSDENIEIVYDREVLSSVVLNRQKRVLEVSARVDTIVDSTLVNINFLQDTTSGKKRIKQTNIYVNLEKMTTSFDFMARDENSEYFNIQDAKLYLPKNGFRYVKCNFSYNLAENNVISDEFSLDKYQIVDSESDYLTIEKYDSNSNYLGFKITSNDKVGNTRIVFEHLESRAKKILEVYVVDNSDIQSSDQSLGSEDNFESNKTIICSFNDKLKIKNGYPIVRDIVKISDVLIEDEYKIDDNLYLKKINGMYYLECGASAPNKDIIIDIVLSSSYFDKQIIGGDYKITYTIKINENVE